MKDTSSYEDVVDGVFGLEIECSPTTMDHSECSECDVITIDGFTHWAYLIVGACNAKTKKTVGKGTMLYLEDIKKLYKYLEMFIARAEVDHARMWKKEHEDTI